MIRLSEEYNNFDREFAIFVEKTEDEKYEEIISALGEKLANDIILSDKDSKKLADKERNSVTLIHKHTNSSAPTVNDFSVFLKYKAIGNMIVFNPFGRYYYIEKNLCKEFFNIEKDHERVCETLREYYERLETKYRKNLLETLSEKDKASLKLDLQLKSHIKNRIILKATEELFLYVNNKINSNYYPKEVL